MPEERKVGIRVGAILKANKDVVHLLGYDVYDGDLTGGPFKDVPNPRITLDSGEVVWGCECWWGSEEKVKESIGTRTVVLTSITEERKKYEASA
jgi:hypothetical protein